MGSDVSKDALESYDSVYLLGDAGMATDPPSRLSSFFLLLWFWPKHEYLLFAVIRDLNFCRYDDCNLISRLVFNFLQLSDLKQVLCLVGGQLLLNATFGASWSSFQV
ncbi:auxin-responsive protein IAA8-like [Pyrus ussuriensis x Pyrus communis]|uniref:Auxin-responsive protein IAA8-like n=1 Tax=Pyrus ussuriensis x Pyrus communis TaxID=2448454 RepID=A0A5N5GNS7_9ROSA|nr:auxin-responsive protein IAA8-like [Pyrus ussuriensis x Pyrus communis]